MKCICKIRNWFSNLGKTQDTKQKKESKYHSLTPINCADNCDVYMDALQEALQNPDIKNIAVTGPYGAGKSSVIRTFFDNHNGEYKHITITLANFLDNNVLENTITQKKQEQLAVKKGDETANSLEDAPQKISSIKGNDLEQLIERSIVQQLFYSVNDSSIPASHFKKIKKQDKFELFCIVLFILLCLLSISYLVRPDILWSILKVTNVPVIIDNIFRVLAFFFAVWGIYEAIKKVVQIAISISVKHLHIKEAGIELDKQEHKSILNYHIDEIIYFFEATEKNIVIIEDIDRFNHQGIFTKLREINYLINNCEKIHQKVVFIYALKDEMFQDKDRTKFFDFIIPIIPIVNYSNSSEILRKEFTLKDDTNEIVEGTKKEIQFKGNITAEFIDDLSLFIDDMRLLYNIINEYNIYSQLITQYNSDAKGLLAMVAYKNLYPEDFALLSQNKGLISEIITNKKEYIKREISRKEKQIEKIQSQIVEIENINKVEIEELRVIYLTQIVQHLTPAFVGFNCSNNKYFSIVECAKSNEYFEMIISQTNIQYTYHPINSYYRSTAPLKFNWDQIQREVNPKYTYKERVDMLNKVQLENLQKSLQQITLEKDQIANQSLQVILQQSDSIKLNSDTYTEYLPAHVECVDVLLRGGYINENYWDYMSMFHEGSLTIGDKQFLINVKRRIKTEYNHQLSQLKNLIVKIKPNDFSKWYILNFNLVDFLLSNEYVMVDETEERKQRVFTLLSTMKAGTMQFIIQYLERKQNTGKFLQELCCYGHNIWKTLIEHTSDIQELRYYFQQIIKHVAIDDIVNQFYMDETNYIENYPDYWLIETDKEKLKEVIQQLNIKFALLSNKTSLEDIDYIYCNNAYQINIEVMRTILSKREQWDDLAFNTRNYSYIVETYPEMTQYIQHNLSEYVDNVFLKLPNNNDIKLEHLIELLNTETLPIDQKKQIISHLTATNPIESITDISDKSLWAEICNNNFMAANWENIKALVHADEINFAEVYTNFLNKEENAKQLSNQKLEEDMNLDEGEVEIAYTLIYNSKLNDKSYHFLLDSLTDVYSLQPTDLAENRMRWLIEKDLIEINVDSYKYLKEHYTPLHIDFLEKHLADFSKSNYQNMDFDAEDMKPILNLNIEVSEKVKIIDSIVDTSIFDNQDEVIQLLASIVLYHFKDHQPKTNIIEYLSLQKALTVDIRKRIYIKYAQYIKDITAFLTNLEEPYSSLLQKDIDTYIPMEDEVFLNTLKEHQHIGPFKKRRNRELWIIKKDAKLFR